MKFNKTLPNTDELFELAETYTKDRCGLSNFNSLHEIELAKIRYIHGYEQALKDYINENYNPDVISTSKCEIKINDIESKIKKLTEDLKCEIFVNHIDKEEDYIGFHSNSASMVIFTKPLYLPKPNMTLVIGSKMRIDKIEELVDNKIQEIEDYLKDNELKLKSENIIKMIEKYSKVKIS